MKTTIPLSPEIMVEYFKDKSVVFEIDMEQSIAAIGMNRFVLVYLANLGIKCTVDKIDADFMKEYMQIAEFCDITNAQMVHANILYYAKFDSILYPQALEMFSEKQMHEFILENDQLILIQMAFLNSLLLYALSTADDYKAKEKLVKHETSERYKELGFNVLKLLDFKDFLLMFLEDMPPLDDQLYFTRYFEEYMYGGKNLFDFFLTKNNLFFAFLHLITTAADTTDSAAALSGIYLKCLELDGTEKEINHFRSSLPPQLAHIGTAVEEVK